MVSYVTIFSLKRSNRLRYLLLLITFTLLLVFTYDKFSSSINSIVRSAESQINPIQKRQVAVIFIEDSTECLKVEFIKNLVYSLNRVKDFDSSYNLHVFALHRNDHSSGCDFFESFVTDVFIDNESSSGSIESLIKHINENRFISVVILQNHEVTSNMWQLTDLGSKLSLNIKVYYVMITMSANPNLEAIGLVRHMANRAVHLIVMTWFDYHSLIHTYGIQETKILHIPYGVSIPKLSKINNNSKSVETLSKYNDQDFVLLSIGSIHSNKNYKRLLLNLKPIIAKVSNLRLLIIGREPVTNTSIMPYMSETVKHLQLENRVIWIDKCMSTEELDVVHKRANAYISVFDEIISTSGSLSNAMAYALPIISTPHIFAMETLTHNRGLIVPFDDDKILTESVIEFLKNRTLRDMFSNNAQEFIKNWTWDNIAKQYTTLFKTGSFTTIESTKSFMHVLGNDPYENEPNLVDTKDSVYWTNKGAISFDHQDVFSSLTEDKAKSGLYTIYADSFLQLNGKINREYQIRTVALQTMDQYVLIDVDCGIQEFNINKQNFTSQIQIDYTVDKLIFTSININFEISRSQREIKIHFLKVNSFTNAFGLIGSTIKAKKIFVQNNTTRIITPLKWFISEKDIFSHTCEGQSLTMYGMENNAFILPELAVLRCSGHMSQKIKIIMETEFFGSSGYSSVNRKMFLSLVRNSDFVISIKPSEKDVNPDGQDLEGKLVYSLYLRQGACIKTYQNSFFQQLTPYKNNTILFRNGWPSDSARTSSREIIIHQQPWEFHAIPKQWIPYFQHKIHELWTPSQYCKSSYVANGVAANKIHVIPHGVFTEKYKRKLRPLELPTNKTLKFLSVGGVLRRKGFDLLFNAYKTTFSSKDDVTLITHSLYADPSGDGIKMRTIKNSTSPEIIHLGYYLNDMNMVRLFKSVDVYVSPYRGEGFGLSILEAMAAGVPPIVTKYGPSLDFCPEECCYFVEAQPTECLTYPCGKMKIFGSETGIQPMLVEPQIQSLSKKMYQAHTDRVQLKERSKICQKHAEYYTWDKVADKIIKRISEITQ